MLAHLEHRGRGPLSPPRLFVLLTRPIQILVPSMDIAGTRTARENVLLFGRHIIFALRRFPLRP